jgi:hypothetical protein
MNNFLIGWGIFAMIGGIVFMVRNDIIGYIIGGVISTIGLGCFLFGLYND